MKKLSFLIFVSIIFLKVSHAQVKSLDSLVGRAFSSIKNVDEHAYIKLYPTYPQLQNLFGEILNSIKDSNLKKGISRDLDKVTEDKYENELKKKFIVSFQKFIAEGRNRGIDWTHAKLDSFTSSEMVPEELRIKSASGKLFFSADDKQYSTYFFDVVWSDREQGWFGFDVSGIRAKGEVEVDSLVYVEDSVEMSVVIDPPDPPPPAKQPVKKPDKKTDIKQPATKQKTKIKPKS